MIFDLIPEQAGHRAINGDLGNSFKPLGRGTWVSDSCCKDMRELYDLQALGLRTILAGGTPKSHKQYR